MAGPGLGDGDLVVAIFRFGGHFFRPVFPVAVFDAKRHR